MLKSMSIEDLEMFIEQKVVEVIGGRDADLQLREDSVHFTSSESLSIKALTY